MEVGVRAADQDLLVGIGEVDALTPLRRHPDRHGAEAATAIRVVVDRDSRDPATTSGVTAMSR